MVPEKWTTKEMGNHTMRIFCFRVVATSCNVGVRCSAVPPGLAVHVYEFPALKRWVKLVRPSGLCDFLAPLHGYTLRLRSGQAHERSVPTLFIAFG
jgi:hypothetical protein